VNCEATGESDIQLFFFFCFLGSPSMEEFQFQMVSEMVNAK
jgi:hypothetical protein